MGMGLGTVWVWIGYMEARLNYSSIYIILTPQKSAREYFTHSNLHLSLTELVLTTLEYLVRPSNKHHHPTNSTRYPSIPSLPYFP